MNRSELAIVIIMRFVGLGGLLAIPVIFIPYSWMNACHELMGLGTMPDTPIVSYLARSLSAFYAIIGTITFYVTLDIRRNRSFVKLWAIIFTVMGVVLFYIDLFSGMPMSWTIGEGPPTLAVGLILLWLQKSITEQPSQVDS